MQDWDTADYYAVGIWPEQDNPTRSMLEDGLLTRNFPQIQIPKTAVLFRQSWSITNDSLDLQCGAGKVGKTWPEHRIPART